MRTLSWIVFLLLCVSCSYALQFLSLSGKAKATTEKVPCGGHFRKRLNRPEHPQDWLWSGWPWLVFIIALSVFLWFPGGSRKKEHNPVGLRSHQFRSPSQKTQNTCSSQDYLFNTLTQLEMDLVKFVAQMRSLKASLESGSSLRLHVPRIRIDSPNKITIYEIWEEES